MFDQNNRSPVRFRHFIRVSQLLATAACFSLVALSANSDIVGLPDDAVIVETQALPVVNRSFLLWMEHPTRHEDTIVDGVYTCPDQTMGHYLEGPTRVSLIDTAVKKVINTVLVRFNWKTDDNFFVPYRIAGFFYSIGPSSNNGEGRPQILTLRDFTGAGEATQFALFDAQNCSIVATTIYGFSRRRDAVVQYPFDMVFEEGGRRERAIQYWLDHFALQKPASTGYWKYSIDYNSGERSTYEIRFDPEQEAFVGKAVVVPIR
jgi:hypothetical protein